MDTAMKTQLYLSFRSEASLVVLEDGAVRSFPLELKKEWTIGRKTPDNIKDIELMSKIASRKHGDIINIDGSWYYIEQGSLNGTYYNGEKLLITEKGVSDAVLLKNGDVLRIDAENLENPEARGVWMMFTTEGIGNQWKNVLLRKKETHFGRDEELCDITIPLPYISARHMTIVHRDNRYYVMDCDSMAGTFLNNEPVHGEVLLKEKDMIAICDCTMIFTGNRIVYNIPVRRENQIKEVQTECVPEQGNMQPVPSQKKPVVLRADIKSRKVKNNNGHGEKELIRNVRVEVEEGSLVALLGGAGAGKSTVMNCMNGMDTAGMSGTVEYNGVDLIKNFDRMKSLIGSVPQQETFHEALTVEQELTHAAKHRLPRDLKRKEI